MIKTVVFDFDDTLVQTDQQKIKSFYDVTKNLKGVKSLLDDEMKRPVRKNRFEMSEMVSSFCFPDHPLKAKTLKEKLIKDYTARVETVAQTAKDIPGAREILLRLNALQIPVYLNSATEEKSLKKVISYKRWPHFFKGIYGAPCSKEENLRKIAQQEKISPNQIVLIGDGEADRLAAKAFGCLFIGFINEKEKFQKPVAFKTDQLYDVFNLLKDKIKI